MVKSWPIKFWFKMAENVSDDNVYLSVLLKKFRILFRIKTFSWMKMRRKTLFSDYGEDITSPDLAEPNFNEMKELKSSIKDAYSLT